MHKNNFPHMCMISNKILSNTILQEMLKVWIVNIPNIAKVNKLRKKPWEQSLHFVVVFASVSLYDTLPCSVSVCQSASISLSDTVKWSDF